MPLVSMVRDERFFYKKFVKLIITMYSLLIKKNNKNFLP